MSAVRHQRNTDLAVHREFAADPFGLAANVVRGWRIPAGSQQAYRLDHETETLDAALNEIAPLCVHKDTLALIERRAGAKSAVLHLYAIKQESRAIYVRNPQTNVPEPVRRLYPSHVASLAVDTFRPSRPFDALLDHPVLNDPTLVDRR